MARWLRVNYGGIHLRKQHNHEWRVPEKYRSFFKFTMVRNPYERLMSWLWHDKANLNYLDGDMIKLLEFLVERCGTDYDDPFLQVPGFYAPQLEWVRRAEVQAVVRLEHKDRELRSLPFVRGPLPKFPWLNQHSRPRQYFKDCFEERAQQLLLAYCREDFDAFGYQI
jgi:hypothetical protein